MFNHSQSNLHFWLILEHQLFWILARTKHTRMVVRTSIDDISPLLTRLTLGFMMKTLPGHAAVMAPSTASAPSAWSPALSMQSSLSTPITTFLTIIAPNALTFFFPGAMTSASFVNNPTCISAWMPPSCPLLPLYQRQHPAYQLNDVLLHAAPLDIYILTNNHLYMLLHPFDINPLVSYFLI